MTLVSQGEFASEFDINQGTVSQALRMFDVNAKSREGRTRLYERSDLMHAMRSYYLLRAFSYQKLMEEFNEKARRFEQ